MIRPGNHVIPVEILLKLKVKQIQRVTNELTECDDVHIATEPGIILVKNGIRINLVAGTGSIIIPDINCLSSVDEIPSIEPVKNEWINTCPVTRKQLLEVKENGQNKTSYINDITIVSLTRKMIYPRVFNGLKVDEILIQKPGEEGIEWIMSDSRLRYPVVYLDQDNVIHVSKGSEEMGKLMILLSYETRCRQYRLIASSR